MSTSSVLSTVASLREVAVRRRGPRREWDWAFPDELTTREIDDAAQLGVGLWTPGAREVGKLLGVSSLVHLGMRDARKLGPKPLAKVLEHAPLEGLSLVWAPLHRLETLRFPPELSWLDLDSAREHDDLPRALSELPKLRHLDLGERPIDADALADLPALERLDISGWPSLPGAALAACPTLREVRALRVEGDAADVAALGGSSVVGLLAPRPLAVAALRALPMEQIGAPGTDPIDDPLVAALVGCPTLQEVFCAGEIDRPRLQAILDGLPKLRSLRLTRNTREAVELLCEHPAPLEELSLGLLPDNTSPPELAVRLAQRPGLRRLGLTNWHVDSAFIAAVRASETLVELDLRLRELGSALVSGGPWCTRLGGLLYVRADAED